MPTSPNLEVTTIRKVLGDNNPDGVFINVASPDLRTNPMQSMIQSGGVGAITNYNANGGALGATAANTTANQTITATGVLATDFPIGITKPTAQANIAYGVGLLTAANGVLTNFSCPNGTVTANGSETYSVTVGRNLNVVTANSGVLSAVPASNNTEVVFNLLGAGAAATATVTGGQISRIDVTAGGTNYLVPPTVVITPTAQTGPSSAAGGSGATAVAVVSGGVVVGVQVLTWGSGYTQGQVTISFIGGNTISLGMLALASKPTFQANLGLGTCRVINNNQVGVTLFTTGAANVTPTANETWSFLALNEIPAMSSIIGISANQANLTAAAANTTGVTALATPGIVVQDTVISASSLTAQANVAFTPGVTAANSFSLTAYAGIAGATPANTIYNYTVNKINVPSPLQLTQFTITPTSVAAASVAEQIFTLPSNVTLTANSTVVVNKPSFTPGITVQPQARANSTSTVGITFINHTAGAIIPPAESYLIANFPTYTPTLSANVLASSCSFPASPTLNQSIDLQNEVQQSLVLAGILKGA